MSRSSAVSDLARSDIIRAACSDFSSGTLASPPSMIVNLESPTGSRSLKIQNHDFIVNKSFAFLFVGKKIAKVRFAFHPATR